MEKWVCEFVCEFQTHWAAYAAKKNGVWSGCSWRWVFKLHAAISNIKIWIPHRIFIYHLPFNTNYFWGKLNIIILNPNFYSLASVEKMFAHIERGTIGQDAFAQTQEARTPSCLTFGFGNRIIISHIVSLKFMFQEFHLFNKTEGYLLRNISSFRRFNNSLTLNWNIDICVDLNCLV